MPTATQSIREIVATRASAAAVLQRFAIDLTSHANHSLTQACADLQLSIEQVLEKLAAAEADETGAPPADPSALPLQKLIQHIVRLHHRSVRQELPRLATMAHKLAVTNGKCMPELIAIDRLMDELQGDVVAHIEEEENALFPYIAYLDQPLGVAAPSGSKGFRRVSQPVCMMMNDHESALRILAELNRLISGIQAPASASAMYDLFCTDLRAFEEDLRRHIHLEDDILFPRAVELEGRLTSPAHG